MLFRAQLYGLVQADWTITWVTKNCATPAAHAMYPIRAFNCPPSLARFTCEQRIMTGRPQTLRQAPGHEVRQTLRAATTQRSSSYSTDEGPDCVEVATIPAHILVRDSKTPDGARLAVTSTAWATFLPYASGR
ncbi:DUF397 domain-containing protein [Streptomyces sp. NPDC054834]